MDGRRHPKRFLGEPGGKGKSLKSFEGLDDGANGDYGFHKDVFESDPPRFAKVVNCIVCDNETADSGKPEGSVCPTCTQFFSGLKPPPEGITD